MVDMIQIHGQTWEYLSSPSFPHADMSMLSSNRFNLNNLNKSLSLGALTAQKARSSTLLFPGFSLDHVQVFE